MLLVQQINHSVADYKLMTMSQFSACGYKTRAKLVGSQKHSFFILDVLDLFGQSEHDAALSPTLAWT